MSLRLVGLGASCLWALACVAGCAVSDEVPNLEIAPRFSSVEGDEPHAWHPGTGWRVSDSAFWGDDENVRVEARKAFDAGAFADALAGFREIEERGASEKLKDLNFYLGECYYRLGHYEEALGHYRSAYRSDFPSAQLVDTARERVFDIGMTYLKLRKTRSIFGITYTAPDYGIEILLDPVEGLITENPHLSFADDGLIAIADHYYDDGQYPEAVPLYEQVLSMDGNEWKDYAEFRAAMAEYQQVRGVAYDQSKMREAQRRFRLYLKRHARGEHGDEAREKTNEIKELESEKNLQIAKFYLQDSQPRACEIYLRIVLDRHPNSRAAQEAREIRRQLDRTRGQW